MLPAQFLDRHTGLGFLQKPDDLLFRKALLHVRLLLRKRNFTRLRLALFVGGRSIRPTNCDMTSRPVRF
ncbi:hypothetical protein DM49_1483 [Burkholderia mallei]|nr:hypothetical protein DM49_1483 [Burkholderia mallei]